MVIEILQIAAKLSSTAKARTERLLRAAGRPSFLLIPLQLGQQAFGRLWIRGFSPLHELIEDRPQQSSTILRLAAIGREPGKIDGGAQLPGTCALSAPRR